ncbi:SIR2 family NAD-dependent protein deacylase [Pollutimonas bauzanensis]|uniref:SIR2-like domain-containing protein n=1 Tax=Pollutimonas bauzanensis TaxID=658167 RepID=A0A1M5Q394_9BURK|nr:SIR2 family protein [Pollutimonas bauzanensis]SHH08209.1 SIR2-like domain-containing protein [Pollutimonas bauzanensis]
MQNKIPGPIKTAIESGNAILFLGAGASFDALVEGKETRIYATTLRDMLADKFLGGAHKNKNLLTVADYARNEASLAKVQSFVRDTFLPLSPAPFHLKIPKFRWKAIVTTNYDLIIERAYTESSDALQTLSPVTKDGEELERALAGQNSVPYLKLHGSITNYADTSVPIVLDSQEYAKFKYGRENLVKAFTEWATQCPIVFCGYSLSDENIKQILFDIGDESQIRDPYLYLNLEFDDIEQRYWYARRILPYTGTFSDFIDAIDSQIHEKNRLLATLFDKDKLSISKWIPSHNQPSDALVQYLYEELLHIEPLAPAMAKPIPRDFYSGLDTSFSPIYAEFDVTRAITNEILNTAVINTLESTEPKLFVIKGYAGCGKSVLAKRVAIETSKLLDSPLVVWLKEGSIIRSQQIIELQQLVKSRLYFFVDDAIEQQEELTALLQTLFTRKIRITVIACGRTNEFNIYGETLSKKISKTFELHDLDDSEVSPLLGKLSEHKILGPLDQYTQIEQKLFIEKLYSQQLLVALHEITFGDSFENILVSEFEKITPREVQQIYLDICTLHQAEVGVRAGLLSRISGVEITKLNDLLIGPLARVVRSNYERRYRDITYQSRHSEIAKLVFSLAITDPKQRAYQLIRILDKIDLNYSSDNKSFFELVRGKRLAELFEEKNLAISVFDAADKNGAPEAFIFHQRAILEINHRLGNLDVASDYVKKAEIANRETGYKDSSIQHTKANLLRKKALKATTLVERERYRADARSILKPQLSTKGNSYPEHLLGQVLLDELKEFFTAPKTDPKSDSTQDAREQSIVRVTSELSSLIESYLLKHPDDSPMTLLRTDFLKTLGNQPKALEILERFHAKNPDNISISRVYGDALVTGGGQGLDDGIAVLRGAVLSAPSDKSANLSLAKALIKKDEFGNAESILSFLRRSFSDGDSHYEARYFFARCNLLYGDVDKGNNEFKQLRDAYLTERDRISFPVCELDGQPKRFKGLVITRQAGYGFIKCAELRFNTFFKRGKISIDTWQSIQNQSEIEFLLYFNYRGPIAIDIRPQQ